MTAPDTKPAPGNYWQPADDIIASTRPPHDRSVRITAPSTEVTMPAPRMIVE
jgi:hypothetical protein